MSYILDALRRADAERERGPIPSVYAPTAHAPDDMLDDEGRRPPPPYRLLTIGGVFGAAVVAAIVWRVMGDTRAPTQPPPLPTAMAPQTLPNSATTPQPQMPDSAAPPVVSTEPVAATAPAPRPAIARTSDAAPTPVAPSVVPRTAPVAPAPVAAAQPPQSAAPQIIVPALSELPDDVKRQVPAIAVGGSIYSPSASSRMVILNGVLYHEHDMVAPNLVVEEIGLKSAIMSWRGTKFRITY